MKPVVIFKPAPIEEPGYFAIFLNHYHISWQLVYLDKSIFLQKT